VQVIEEEDRRLPLTSGVYQTADKRKQLSLPSLGVNLQTGSSWVRHAKEVEDKRESLAEGLIQQEQSPGDLLSRKLVAVLLRNRKRRAQEFENGNQVDSLPVGWTVRFENPSPLRTAAFHELSAQAALPDPRFSHDSYHLPVTFNGAVQCCFQNGQLIAPTHESGKAAKASRVESSSGGTGGLQLMDS
jgi:hypothetical protein